MIVYLRLQLSIDILMLIVSPSGSLKGAVFWSIINVQCNDTSVTSVELLSQRFFNLWVHRDDDISKIDFVLNIFLVLEHTTGGGSITLTF